jgi:hypothetical protein
MERVNEAGWDELLQNSEKLVELVAKTESPVFTLGLLPVLSQD